MAGSEEGFRDYCRRKIAPYKTPEFIRLVDEFPMTVTGKLQKLPHSGAGNGHFAV